MEIASQSRSCTIWQSAVDALDSLAATVSFPVTFTKIARMEVKLTCLLSRQNLDWVFGSRQIELIIVNRGKWLGSLAKFFVLCFCSLLWP